MIRVVSLAALLALAGLPAQAQFTSESGGGSAGGYSGGSMGGSGSSDSDGSSGSVSRFGGGSFTTPSVGEAVRPAPFRQAVPSTPMGQPFTDPSPASSPRY